MANVKKTDAERAAAKAEREKAKVENFVRLANARVNNALAAIENIGGLANTATYTYSQEQVDKIMQALEGSVLKTAKRFAAPDTAKGAGFTL